MALFAKTQEDGECQLRSVIPSELLPVAAETEIGGVKRNAGSAGQFVTGVDTDGSLLRAAANNYTHPNHTGDVTSVGDGATKIEDGKVTNAKLAVMSGPRFKGRFIAGSGAVEDITAANARTMLNVEDGATADQTGAEIKALYEAEADTNAYTDAEKAKVAATTGTNTGDQDLSGLMVKTANLSDVADVPTARTNLGLGTAAQSNTEDFATAAQGTDERVPTAAGLTTKFGTNKASIVDGDKFNILDSEASSVPKHTLWSLIKSTLKTYLDDFYASINAGFSTGDVKFAMKTTADSGWVFSTGTIGSGSSGASTRANADCEALFLLLWDEFSDTYAPVSGGRGASAAADWAANKVIGIPDARGRILCAQDDMGGSAAGVVTVAGSGVNGAIMGFPGGEEDHQLTAAESGLPSHTHSAANQNTVTRTSGGANTGGVFGAQTGAASANASLFHNNMPPVLILPLFVKL